MVSLVGYLTVLVQQFGLASALSVACTVAPVPATRRSVVWGGPPPLRRALPRTLRRGFSRRPAVLSDRMESAQCRAGR